MNNKKGLIVGITIIVLAIAGFIIYKSVGGNTNKPGNVDGLTTLFDGKQAGVVKDDVFSKQELADKAIEEAANDSKYTLESPYVVKNPYGDSPLTAIIVFSGSKESEATLSVNGNSVTFEKSKTHILPVYGLVAGKSNEIQVSCDGKVKTITIDTKDVKNAFDINIIKKEKIIDANGMYVVGDGIGYYGFNSNGEMVWVLDRNYKGTIYPMANGHFLIMDNSYMGEYYNKALLEVDYLGKIHNNYDFETGIYEDYLILDNGDILAVSNSTKHGTYDDLIVEVNPTTGKIVDSIDLYDIISDISPKFISKLNADENAVTNWANAASIYYQNGKLYVSLIRRNSILCIDYKTAKLDWIFGDIKNWNKDFAPYMLKISGTNAFAVNELSVDKDGNFLLFDNAYNNTLLNDVCKKYTNAYSSAKKIKIDATNKTATLVSNFNDGKSMFSYAVSGYSQAYDGSYIVASTWELDKSHFKQAYCTLNGEISNITTKFYELDENNNIVFKAKMSKGSYNGTKLQFYNKNIKNRNFSYRITNYLSTLNQALYEKIKVKDIQKDLENASSVNLSLIISKSLISLPAAFAPDDEAYIILVGEDGYAHKYLIKSKNGYSQLSVNLRGVTGTFAAYYEMNDEFYSLDKVYKID